MDVNAILSATQLFIATGSKQLKHCNMTSGVSPLCVVVLSVLASSFLKFSHGRRRYLASCIIIFHERVKENIKFVSSNERIMFGLLII